MSRESKDIREPLSILTLSLALNYPVGVQSVSLESNLPSEDDSNFAIKLSLNYPVGVRRVSENDILKKNRSKQNSFLKLASAVWLRKKGPKPLFIIE